MTYAVIAYRWGWTNNHQYFVYVGPDETKALALAKAEADDRGGKYGCAVLKFNDNGTDYERVAYEPSTYGEAGPARNHRIDMFKSLGHVMHDFAAGAVLLPSPNMDGTLKQVKVEPPEWVVAEVKRREEFASAMTAAMTAQGKL